MAGNKLEVKLVRSLIGNKGSTKLIANSIGLRRIGSTIILPDTPASAGQIRRLKHLVAVRPYEGAQNG